MIALQGELDRVWPPYKRWPVRTEVHRDGLEYRFYLGELPDVDPRWAFMAGEVMFNFRAALDYLAYELHVRRYRGVLPRGVEGITQFPIYKGPGGFNNNRHRIANLSQRDRTALQHLQPYVARRDKWAHVRRDLADLNTLHNVDKHRKLHVVASAQVLATETRFPPDVGFQAQFIWGPKESQSHVETWTFAKPPREMEDHRGAFVTLALDDEGQLSDLMAVLQSYDTSVRRVLDRFRGRFASLAQRV